MKKILKVKIKAPKIVDKEFAKEIYNAGTPVAHFAISNDSAVFRVCNFRYNGHLYFMVLANWRIKECLEL